MKQNIDNMACNTDTIPPPPPPAEEHNTGDFMLLKERLRADGDFCFRYRSYLPLVLFPLLFLVVLIFGQELATEHGHHEPHWLWLTMDDVHWNEPLIIVSLLVGIAGELVRMFVAGHAAKNTSGRNTKAQQAESINTTGAYSLCRNPLYFGNFLMMLSPVLLVGNFLFVIVFMLAFWLYYERIIFAEEVFLQDKFGLDYLQWAHRTPCFLPRFAHYRSPELPFSWKTMLRKEFNSIFALATTLFAVHYLLGIKATQAILIEPNRLLSVFFVLVGGFYIIIRIMVKKTAFFQGEDVR